MKNGMVATAMLLYAGAAQASEDQETLVPFVSTDRLDYLPGEDAVITGGGFHPGEVVTLQVAHEDGGIEGGAGHEPWTVTTGPNGGFSTNWYVDPDDSLGELFVLTADCEDGLHAEIRFTDAAITTVVLNQVDSGWYLLNFGHQPANTNYFVGLSDQYRDFFVFDLTGLEGEVTDARIIIPTGCHSGALGQLFLHEVTTPIAQLLAGGVREDIRQDLGDGPIYGQGASIAVGPANIPFNSNGWTALTTALGGQFAVGGRYQSSQPGAWWLGCTLGGTQLVLTIAPASNKPPIAMCQDVVVCAEVGQCTAGFASIDAGSYDPDGDPIQASQSPEAPYAVGTTPVTLQVRDDRLAQSECSASVQVNDCQDPAIACPPDVSYGTDPGVCAAQLPSLGTPTTADNCGIASVANAAPAFFPKGSTTVTWLATDIAGNVAGCEQTVQIADDEAPAIACPAPATVECTDLFSAFFTPLSAAGADNCDVPTIQAPPARTFPYGPTLLEYQATDAAGNTATCTTDVMVIDTTSPTVACPPPVSVECDLPGSGHADPGTASAQDACSPADSIAVTSDGPPGGVYPIGVTTVSFTAVDAAGWADSCATTVTVLDTTAPSVTCPAPAIAECTGSASAVVDPGDAIGSDVCGGVTLTDPGAGNYPLGTTTVRYDATDDVGLTSSCDTFVTVQDTTPPLIECPPPIVTECVGALSAPVDPAPANALDVCGAVVADDPPATDFPLGTTTLPYAATDAVGLQAQCSTTISVIDTLPPVFADVAAPIEAECESEAGTAVQVPLPVAFDDCEGQVLVTSDAPSLFPMGTTVVTFTAVDGAGNVAQTVTTVTIIDTRPPAFSDVPPAVLVEQESPSGTALTIPLPTATDECDGSVPVESDAPAIFPAGTTVVTFTARDDSGNVMTTLTTVTVVDTTPPAIGEVTASPGTFWPPDHRMEAVTIGASASDAADPDPACEVVAVASNEPVNGLGDGDTAPDWGITSALALSLRVERWGRGSGRIYTITVRCTDSSGNASTGMATVTIPKNQAP